MEPSNRSETRNPDGTFKPGVSGNPNGRPKGTLKDYVRRKFMEMTDEEKQKWIDENKISAIDQWRMSEGNPKQDTDITSDNKPLQPLLVKFLDDNGNTKGV